MNEKVREAIGRLRRNQPRNPDTLLVCEDWEAQAAEIRALREQIGQPQQPKPKFDKTAYQRKLMRERRAKSKTKSK